MVLSHEDLITALFGGSSIMYVIPLWRFRCCSSRHSGMWPSHGAYGRSPRAFLSSPSVANNPLPFLSWIMRSLRWFLSKSSTRVIRLFSFRSLLLFSIITIEEAENYVRCSAQPFSRGWWRFCTIPLLLLPASASISSVYFSSCSETWQSRLLPGASLQLIVPCCWNTASWTRWQNDFAFEDLVVALCLRRSVACDVVWHRTCLFLLDLFIWNRPGKQNKEESRGTLDLWFLRKALDVEVLLGLSWTTAVAILYFACKDFNWMYCSVWCIFQIPNSFFLPIIFQVKIFTEKQTWQW